ncbi:mechanosensitive ion channel family protein [Psychrobacter sp. I-STPA6b]|uniref:mechanosensitive ion channel family protein n=1 Tax=Psychrobacter sp. I-STPA6b TaxID=2585718 RepID=UPI001D0C0865|nr:mechanosensitive ion channel family protein [Psychrobacter sp. I-STPA6b]
MNEKVLLVDFEKYGKLAVDMSVKIAIAIIIFLIGKWVVERLVKIADGMMQRSHLDDTMARFLSNILYGVLLVLVGMAALNEIGVNTTSAVAILGGATVAVGISLKDQLSNFAAGVVIVVFRPFSRGDYIEVNDTKGTVEIINILHTRLITPNNHELIIPNSKISTTEVINYTSIPNRRVDVVVGIGYSDDIKTAKEIMLKIAQEHELVFKDPEPIVRVTNLGDSSVDLTMNVWTTNDDWWKANCDLLEKIKYALDEQGIEIPFPQRSVHVVGLEDMVKQLQVSSATPVELQKEQGGDYS